ncbi:unnamed protein product [Schistocephalus solidus]|uniref:Uncharacterized protein n=1 Tax=Schistocephalus solidus TaxID=70667 RepID=A0A183SLC3_SCHSO|nr:unnamed protein product [Schistocephalus solidus]
MPGLKTGSRKPEMERAQVAGTPNSGREEFTRGVSKTRRPPDAETRPPHKARAPETPLEESLVGLKVRKSFRNRVSNLAAKQSSNFLRSRQVMRQRTRKMFAGFSPQPVFRHKQHQQQQQQQPAGQVQQSPVVSTTTPEGAELVPARTASLLDGLPAFTANITALSAILEACLLSLYNAYALRQSVMSPSRSTDGIPAALFGGSIFSAAIPTPAAVTAPNMLSPRVRTDLTSGSILLHTPTERHVAQSSSVGSSASSPLPPPLPSLTNCQTSVASTISTRGEQSEQEIPLSRVSLPILVPTEMPPICQFLPAFRLQGWLLRSRVSVSQSVLAPMTSRLPREKQITASNRMRILCLLCRNYVDHVFTSSTLSQEALCQLALLLGPRGMQHSLPPRLLTAKFSKHRRKRGWNKICRKRFENIRTVDVSSLASTDTLAMATSAQPATAAHSAELRTTNGHKRLSSEDSAPLEGPEASTSISASCSSSSPSSAFSTNASDDDETGSNISIYSNSSITSGGLDEKDGSPPDGIHSNNNAGPQKTDSDGAPDEDDEYLSSTADPDPSALDEERRSRKTASPSFVSSAAVVSSAASTATSKDAVSLCCSHLVSA